MLNRFKHKVEELRGLIDVSRSAPSVIHLLAVSGGMDSMCLADLWLRSFGADSFAIAHCNFNLRGEDSDADERLVTEWAAANDVKLHKVSFDTMKYVKVEGVSVEMAARELRYNWFAQLCEDYGYAAVVTAHHADDNAETMILNMVRGTGLNGMTGMSFISTIPLSSRSLSSRAALQTLSSRACREIPLLRPLLTFTRKQIEGYVFANKILYREDKTNASVEYRRNSVRHEVLPIFERMNPSVVRTLNREMTYFNDASSIVEDWCRTQLPNVLAHHCEEARRTDVAISIPKLMALPQWRYLLYYILQPYGFNSSVLESIESLLTSDRTVSGKRFEAPGYVLLTERDSMVVVRKMAGHTGHDAHVIPDIPDVHVIPDIHDAHVIPDVHDVHVIPDLIGDPFMPVRGAGKYNINGQSVAVEVLPWTPDMPKKQPAGTLIFDASRLKFPFVLRNWRSGDWMIPFGMKGKKKISDLFTDLKLTHSEKEQSVILVDCTSDMAEQQHVAAVLGMRIDDRYKVTDKTKQIIKITLLS